MIRKVQIRFPNEGFFESLKIDLDKFKPHRVFEDEVFGFIGEKYIAIKKNTLPKDFLGE